MDVADNIQSIKLLSFGGTTIALRDKTEMIDMIFLKKYNENEFQFQY